MKIVALCGFAQTGKDTAYWQLRALDPNWQRFAFADALKEDISFLPGLVGYATPENKEALRDLYVAYGATTRHFDPDHWIHRLMRSIRAATPESGDMAAVVTDCRYTNEVRAIQEAGGLCVYISRPGYDAANAEERRSIKEIRERWPDMPTICNKFTPEVLGMKLREIIKARWPDVGAGSV